MPSFQFGGTQTSNIAALDTTSRSGAVFLAGMGLIVANALLTPAGRDIWFHLFLPRKSDTTGIAPGGLPDILLEVGLVLALTLIASINDGLGVVALAILVAMWLVWLVRVNPAHFIPGA